MINLCKIWAVLDIIVTILMIIAVAIIATNELNRYMCMASYRDYYPVRYNYYLGCQIKPEDKWENVTNGAN